VLGTSNGNIIEKKPLPTSFFLSGGFVNDGAVFQAPEVEHPNASVLPATDKDVYTVCAKPNIIYLLVVGNQLGLGRQ
jgi:hypothetical protein